jgi:hypothetical protein
VQPTLTDEDIRRIELSLAIAPSLPADIARQLLEAH